MKKISVLAFVMLLSTAASFAQKYAFVDTEYIRKNIPAFNTAQEQLDKLSKQWEKEVADGYAVVEQMYKSYQNESVLLNLASECYHGLDDMGTSMWEALIQSENIQAAYESLLSEYEVDEITLQKDLGEFIETLVGRGLVEVVDR